MANQYAPIYNPEICDTIVELFRDGSSITKVCAVKLGIGRSTYYQWKEEHPEFKEAAERGEELAEAYHENIMEDGANGKIKDYNATTRIFIVKNRFRKTYGEQKDEKDKSAAESVLEQLMAGKIKIVENKE